MPGASPSSTPPPSPPPGAGAPALRILLLEDNVPHAELIEHYLREAGVHFTLTRVDSRPAYLEQLERHPPDMILSDYALPAFDGYAALAIAREQAPDVPFIFVTGTMGEEVAIETLKNGATDYVLKTRLGRLGPAVHRALRESAERRERHRAEDELRKSLEQLRALSTYLQEVREEERTRISREVHDGLGQALTGLKLDLAWLSLKLVRAQVPVQEKVKAMVAHLDDTIQAVRRIATELRPGILDSFGLGAALEWQANDFASRSGLSCAVDISASDPSPDPEQEYSTVFFRIFQETLTNVIRHAQAKHVEVRLFEEHGHLVLTVRDDGRGIAPHQLAKPGSNGLVGMRERAKLIGGQLTLAGAPGAGTTVTLRAPLLQPPPPSPGQ